VKLKAGDIAIYSPPRVRYEYGRTLKSGYPVMVIDPDPFNDASFVRVLTHLGMVEVVVRSYLREMKE
jgi:hypothetical protein